MPNIKTSLLSISESDTHPLASATNSNPIVRGKSFKMSSSDEANKNGLVDETSETVENNFKERYEESVFSPSEDDSRSVLGVQLQSLWSAASAV